MNLIKKYLITIEDKKNVFVKMKLNLEMADDNVEATQVLKDANLSLKDYQQISLDLEE